MASPAPEETRPPHLDPARWDELIESVGPPSILVLIFSWMGDRAKQLCSPEDIWQETLLMAWRDREKHEWCGNRQYRRWLLAIAKNRIRDTVSQHAAKKRGGDQSIRSLSSVIGDGRPSDLPLTESTTPSRIALHREKARQMALALEALPDELKAVVQRYLFEEIGMEEIADELGIGLAAAWYRFRKGAAIYAKNLRQRGVSGFGSTSGVSRKIER